MLTVGYVTNLLPGIVVAASTATIGALCEAIYITLRVRPILKDRLKTAPRCNERLTLPAIVSFYVPLSMTSIMLYVMRPVLSASISRMPEALASLAALPVVTGILSVLRSIGASYNEVVVALVAQPGSARNLYRFSVSLVAFVSVGLLVVALTPFADFWFTRVSGLGDSLAGLARASLCFCILLPGLSVLQSWFQGTILYGGKTRSISEAVLIYLAISGAVLVGGIAWGKVTGLYVGFVAVSIGEAARTLWLWLRSRAIRERLRQRDACAYGDSV
jgi:hypothetical protein